MFGGAGGDRGQRRKIETDTEACIWSLRDWALVLDEITKHLSGYLEHVNLRKGNVIDYFCSIINEQIHSFQMPQSFKPLAEGS